MTTCSACRTGDRALITEYSGLVVMGRLDEVVKVSGVPRPDCGRQLAGQHCLKQDASPVPSDAGMSSVSLVGPGRSCGGCACPAGMCMD